MHADDADKDVEESQQEPEKVENPKFLRENGKNMKEQLKFLNTLNQNKFGKQFILENVTVL